MPFHHFRQVGYTHTHPDTYKVLAVSDLHIDDTFTLFHNRRVDGFFQLLNWVDEVVLDGDTFVAGVKEKDAGPKSEENDPWVKTDTKYALWNRYDPKSFICDDILKPYPHLGLTYVPANHDGMSAKDRNDFTDMLHGVSRRHSNFSCRDVYQRGDLILFHGHTHFEYVHHDERGDFYYKVYTEGVHSNGGRYIAVPAYDRYNQQMAEAICETNVVREFVASRREATQHGCGEGLNVEPLHLYVGIGNRHRKLDKTVGLADGVNVHVTDLGCTVQHKGSNFKIYHYLGNEIVWVETVNLKQISEQAEKYPARPGERRHTFKFDKVA